MAAAGSDKRYTCCGVCGRKRLHTRAAPVPLRSRYDGKHLPAGTLVCGSHIDRLLPASHPYFDLLDAPLNRRTLAGWVDEVRAWTRGPKPADISDGEWAYLQQAPQWLADTLAQTGDGDLGALRNTALDLVLRARGITLQMRPDAILGTHP